MTNMTYNPNRRDRHQHPTHFVYLLEVNGKQGWRRWLKVAVCDECSHQQWCGVTYDQPPKELIWREENGEIKPQTEEKDGESHADESGEEVPSTNLREPSVGTEVGEPLSEGSDVTSTSVSEET